MADQITKSVRRIVKGMKDDPTGLGVADDYKGIGTSRGEAFINSRGDVTGSGSDGSGEDKDEQPPSSTPATGNPEDNDTGSTGGINDGTDPTEALAGDVDAVVPVIDTDTQVGTVTGTDPTTGDPLSLNVNTLDGIEYTPPAGFDNLDGYETTISTDIEPDCAFLAAIACPIPQDGAVGGSAYYTGDQKTYVLTHWSTVRGSQPASGWFGRIDNCGAVGCTPLADGEGDVTIPGTFRTTTTSESGQTIPADWPSDSNCQVVWDNAAGGYKGNVKDPDCSAAQKVASPSIIIRSVDDTNKYYKFTKLADGGMKITEVDNVGVIIPDSKIKTIDEGGRYSNVYVAALDASII